MSIKSSFKADSSSSKAVPQFSGTVYIISPLFPAQLISTRAIVACACSAPRLPGLLAAIRRQPLSGSVIDFFILNIAFYYGLVRPGRFFTNGRGAAKVCGDFQGIELFGISYQSARASAFFMRFIHRKSRASAPINPHHIVV